MSPDPMDDQDVTVFSPVNIFRGDNFFANEKIDFIKMDVESMEMFVLEGLQETILKNRPKMYVEVMKENLDEFNLWLEKNSYRCVKATPEPGPLELYSNHFVVPNI